MDEPEMVPVTREQLYEQIWSMPVSRVCRMYGWSDVALAKFCEEWDIPRPPRGYWARKRSGKPTRKRKLKPFEDGNPVVLHFRPTPPEEEKERPPTEADRRRAFERRPENQIVVQEMVTEPHLLVVRTEKSISAAKPNEEGICRAAGLQCLDLEVSPALIDRSLRILDTIIKALEARGFPVSTTNGERPATFATVLEEKIGFRLYEDRERRERPPTPAETRDNEFWARIGRPPRRYYAWRAAGRLVLRITTGGGLGRCWSDRGNRRVEQFLNTFVVALVRAAENVKTERIAAAERHRQHEEEVRRQKDEELRRKEEARRQRETERLRQEDEARFRQLEAQAVDWKRARLIRAYLDAVRAVAVEKGEPIEAGSEVDRWLKWAECRAAVLDSTAHPLQAPTACSEIGHSALPNTEFSKGPSV